MLKGFKDFVMRGNVIDLAVAVIIGTAFTAIVTAVVDKVLNPLIATFGGDSHIGWAVQLNGDNPKSILDFGAILTAVLSFLTVAAVLYFLLILPMKKMQERRKRGEEPPPAEPTDIELLTEIRDLLRAQQRPQHPQQPHPQQSHPQAQQPQQSHPQQPQPHQPPPRTHRQRI